MDEEIGERKRKDGLSGGGSNTSEASVGFSGWKVESGWSMVEQLQVGRQSEGSSASVDRIAAALPLELCSVRPSSGQVSVRLTRVHTYKTFSQSRLSHPHPHSTAIAQHRSSRPAAAYHNTTNFSYSLSHPQRPSQNANSNI